jgi:anti-sigma regulatory factor (Ser/Thr protein kinase)
MHEVFPMDDPSRVGEARRRAAQLAAHAGLDETAAGRLAIIVNELGNNLVRHARAGRLLLGTGESEVEVIAIDEGPGIADLPRSMRDGFSTGGTPGTGLGAVKRLSQQFDMHSVAGEGTVTLARVQGEGQREPDGKIRVAGVATAAPGEQVCGDTWAAWVTDDAAVLMVADGLGHGIAAAEASQDAISVLQAKRDASLREVVETAHEKLRTTRGAAVGLMRAEGETVRCCGAGNVLARVVSGVHDKVITTQHGTLGVQMRRTEETNHAWPAHAIIVAHSDGIESRWRTDRVIPLLSRDPVLVAAVLLRDHTRGRDDATIVVVQRRAGA